MTHDPMHWQLTLVRLKTRKDGGTYWGSVKDTAANRNAGRFQKMEKQGDQYSDMRGAGLTYDVRPITPRQEARMVERATLHHVARTLEASQATDAGTQTIVQAPRLSYRAQQMAKRVLA